MGTDMTCGCGKLGRYSISTPNGEILYSCNKYKRCLTPEEEKLKLEKETKFNKDLIVRILYTNYKGEPGYRSIVPEKIIYESNEFHKEKQWILVAYDMDKEAERRFAIKDIHSWSAV